MKKKKRFFVLFCLFLLTTGCMREKVDMAIHKDKSMDINIDMGISKAFMEAYNKEQEDGNIGLGSDLDFFSEEELEEMRKAGIEVDKYDDGKYTGMKMLLKVKNIDAVSSSKEVIGDLEELMNKTTKQEEEEDVYLFTVKKGFLKNKYTAKLNMSLLDETMNDSFSDEDAVVGTDTMDSSWLSSGMDASFSVQLPYKAKSNNATTVENDGKKLSWDLVQFEDTVAFSFELYNNSNFYILGAGIFLVLLILIMIVVLFTRKRGNKKILDNQVDMSRGTKEQYYSIPNQEPIPVASPKQEINGARPQVVEPAGQPSSIPSSLRVEPPTNIEPNRIDSPNISLANGVSSSLHPQGQNQTVPSQPINPMPIPPVTPSAPTPIPQPVAPMNQPQSQAPASIPVPNQVKTVQPSVSPSMSGQPQMNPGVQNRMNPNQPSMNNTQMANQIPTNKQQTNMPLKQPMPSPIPPTSVQNRQEGSTSTASVNPMDIFGQPINKDVNK